MTHPHVHLHPRASRQHLPTLLPALHLLPRATPALLENRFLLDRVDRKFVLDPQRAELFLRGLLEHYHVLASGDGGFARYETCYFDTTTLDAFHEHIRGRRPRFKVRVRHHVDRGQAFLEIKRKGANDRSEKHRRRRDDALEHLTGDELSFIRAHAPFDPCRLVPSVWTNFYRATLLGHVTEERITIDFGLHFERNGDTRLEADLGIIELKQRRLSNSTPAMRRLHELGVREQALSKYCTGVARLHEAARPRYRQLVLKRLSRLREWNIT